MSSLLRDIRFSARALIASPGPTAVSVLALALGVGVTTTMFSIVYGAVLRGLPFERGDRIYAIERYDVVENADRSVPIHDYLDWRARQTTFEELGAFHSRSVTISGEEAAERFRGSVVTVTTLSLLGVPPHLGRLFVEGEDAPEAAATIILGYHVWRDRYGSDPGIVGEVIRVDGEPTTVVGVMPEGFRFPVIHDVWLPLRSASAATPRGEGTWMNVVGLLAADRSLDEARSELEGIAEQLARAWPESNENLTVVIEPFTRAFIGDEPVAMLWTMLGAVFAVLAIACVNVANLLVSRAFDRSRELAIRTALGARRWSVLRQSFLEAALLATGGAVGGVLLARGGVAWFNGAIAGTGAPFFLDIRVDAPILLFVLGTTSLATLLAGMLPALQILRSDLNEILTDESRGSSSFRLGRISRILVTAQVALSCMLLVSAGLMIRSVVNLGAIDYGFDTEALLTAQVVLSGDDYADVDSRELLFDRLQRSLSEHPGIESAALMTYLPVSEPPNRQFLIEGEAEDGIDRQRDANVVVVSPGTFGVFDRELVGGRDFADADTRDSLPVVIVNETFVLRYLPGRDPLGVRLRFAPAGGDEDRWHTIVGVAPDLFVDGPQNESPDGMYVPLSQNDAVWAPRIALRGEADPRALIPELRGAVAALDPDLPVSNLQTMAEHIRGQTWFYWVFGSLFAAFGVAALLLAAIGLYGVMAFAVRRRTGEIGIRMALGADARGVLALVLRGGLLQLGIGLAIGMLLASGLGSLLEALLFNVTPGDPVTFAGIAATLLGTGLAAILIPARRAARTDPLIALRKQ